MIIRFVRAPLVFLSLLAALSFASARAAHADAIRVDVTPGHAVNSFSPLRALGAGIDRIATQATDALYLRPQLEKVLAAGWGAVTYRLNTELHVEAWHWNPAGTWSDPAGQGYFTGNAEPSATLIRHSFGYPLPHRGFTRNEGTENAGFSRLTDGDERTYWKSNPYLAPAYTGEDEAPFPQWIVVDLGTRRTIDSMRIAWGEPYARKYQIEYWTGEDAMKKPTQGQWVAFPAGKIANATGGSATLRLSPKPMDVRFLRVLMGSSSETCGPRGPADRRNCLGYAIKELFIGSATANGQLDDIVTHSPDQKQTATYCSSVDPWHAKADLAQEAGDQSGLDLFYTSGVTRGLPAMIPVAVLYGTPEDAAAEIRYLQKRGYPISHVELGEEPDGQYMTPEHYGALYVQWARALHQVDPKLKLGGPIFTGVNEDIPFWPDAAGNSSWFGRFLHYLEKHGRLGDLAFMSFEHYPFDPCKWNWDDIYDEPRRISHIMDVWRKDGLPRNVPMLVTEVNIAWQSGQRFVDIFGALWLADYVGSFLAAGGAGTYFFHYLPQPIDQVCDGTRGTFALHSTDDRFRIKQPLAQFFASQLIAKEWVQPGDDKHEVFPVTSELKDAAGHTVVTGYAVHRPDGQWSVMLVNKDRAHAYPAQVVFHDAQAAKDLSFSGPVSQVTFGAAQYQWHPGPVSGVRGRDTGRAAPDGPPLSSKLEAPASGIFTLPRASVTVLRGTLAESKARPSR